jgi:hypothetical protein
VPEEKFAGGSGAFDDRAGSRQRISERFPENSSKAQSKKEQTLLSK